MKLKRTLALAAMGVFLGVGMLAAQPVMKKDAKPDCTKIERPQRETDEMKSLRHKQYEFRVDMLNLMVKHNRMDKARAEFMLKKMKNTKAFKDANPEWVKYQRHHSGMKQARPGKNQCPAMTKHQGRPGKGDRKAQGGKHANMDAGQSLPCPEMDD